MYNRSGGRSPSQELPKPPEAFPKLPKAFPKSSPSFISDSWSQLGRSCSQLGRSRGQLGTNLSSQVDPKSSFGLPNRSQRKCQFRHAQLLGKVTCDASQGMIFARVAFLGDRYLRGLSSQISNHYDVLGGRFASRSRTDQFLDTLLSLPLSEIHRI